MLGQLLTRRLFRPVIACSRQKWTNPVVLVNHTPKLSPQKCGIPLRKDFFVFHSVRQSSTSPSKMGPIRNKDGSEEDPAKIVDDTIGQNSVVIFSKSYCPFCTKVKDFFAGKGIEFIALELDTMGNQGAEIQSALLERTRQSTVPSVWVNGKFIGKTFDLFYSGDVNSEPPNYGNI